jgi:hypothetical protein
VLCKEKGGNVGTDRSRAYYGPCPCGSGEIEIDFCTPDHPWATKSNWFEPRISCEQCAKKYTFEEQDNQYGLVDKREIKERENRYEAYRAAKSDLLSSPQAKKALSGFIKLLDGQPSMAAAHRLLSAQGLVHGSYGTFIKRWNGAEAWVQSNIHLHAEHLDRLTEILGMKDEYISTAVSDLKRLWELYRRPLPFHDNPLIDTSSYHG